MSKTFEPKSIEQLLAEADELIRLINTDVIKDMQAEHRLQFEKHAQNFKRIKSDAQGIIESHGASHRDSGAEGVREAILEIVKAMHNFKKDLFNT